MSYSEDQVDELLQASAEHWRASLPVPTEPDVAGLVRRRRRRTAWPYPAAAGLAAVVVSVAVLALVVGSRYGVFGPAGSTPSATPAVIAAAVEGPLTLELTAGKATYSEGEAIDVSATLTYSGPDASITVSHTGSAPIGFGIVEKVNGVQLVPIQILTCEQTTLSRGVGLTRAFEKSGALPAGDSGLSPSERAFLEDSVLRLPAGTWHIYAQAGLLEGPCGATARTDNLRAEVTVAVSSATATPSLSPSPIPSSCCTHGPTAWPGGISQQEAEQRALSLVPTTGSSAPTVVREGFEFDPFLLRTAPDRKPVWEIRVAGGIAAPTCAPGYLDRTPSASDPLCLDSDGSVIVVLDFYDGSLIGFLH